MEPGRAHQRPEPPMDEKSLPSKHLREKAPGVGASWVVAFQDPLNPPVGSASAALQDGCFCSVWTMLPRRVQRLHEGRAFQTSSGQDSDS